MRGVFSVGALDVFLESGFHPFDLAVGVSAGACNLASHLAGQDGRNRRAYFELMTSRDFIDPLRALRGGSVVDLDWLWDALARREPLDVERIVGGTTEFVVVGTSPDTGRPFYVVPQLANMFDALKGSCALPGLYRRTVVLDGAPMMDGGVADPIPVEEAYRRGARRIIVVRSRPASYIKKPRFENHIASALFRKRPAMIEAIHRSPSEYRRAVEFIHSPPSDCAIFQVAPPESLSTSRTGRDPTKLKRDYDLGRKLAHDAMKWWNG